MSTHSTFTFSPRFGVLLLMIVLAAASRLVPHPYNFSPIDAMTLFGAAYFAQRWQAFFIPLAAAWLSDLFINNVLYAEYYPHFTFFAEGSMWVYAGYVLIALFGMTVLRSNTAGNRSGILRVAGSTVAAGLIFFLASNFGCWIGSTTYPQTLVGLGMCYVAGIPFYAGTLAGDMAYSALLFGSFAVLQARFPRLAVA